MHLHEYQAKAILKEGGILSPPFVIVSSLEEASEAMNQLRWKEVVVKAQIHTGARGKAGGIKFANSKKEVLEAVHYLLGRRIFSEQTGKEGLPVHQVMLTEKTEVKKEVYVGAALDRKKEKCFLILSQEGGQEIESVEESKILKLEIGLDGSFDQAAACRFMQFENADLLERFVKIFIEKEALLFEINPLVLTAKGQWLALDAKLTVDDNALFRQQEIASFFDPTQLTSAEVRAHKYDLSWVTLKGSIGCMVNGAGLAMATVDMLDYFGGKAANFLDVGGSATKERVAAGLYLLLDERGIKAILINIFGGIMDCVTVVEGILQMKEKIKTGEIPIVLRLEGTNVEKAKNLLFREKLNVTLADSLEDGARKAIIAAGIL